MIRIACRRLLLSSTLVKPGWPAASSKHFSLAASFGANKPVFDLTSIGLKEFTNSRVLAMNASKDTNKLGTQALPCRTCSIEISMSSFFSDEVKAKLTAAAVYQSEAFDLSTFPEDLRYLMLLANTDEDIDLVVKSLKLCVHWTLSGLSAGFRMSPF